LSSRVRVEFLGPIGVEPIEIEADTLADVKEHLASDEKLSEWLSNSAVAINDEIVNTLDIALNEGDRISLLPPVCGG
jgi:molybdopterin synthase sulfur carrier subunit